MRFRFNGTIRHSKSTHFGRNSQIVIDLLRSQSEPVLWSQSRANHSSSLVLSTKLCSLLFKKQASQMVQFNCSNSSERQDCFSFTRRLGLLSKFFFTFLSVSTNSLAQKMNITKLLKVCSLTLSVLFNFDQNTTGYILFQFEYFFKDNEYICSAITKLFCLAL